MIKIAICDDEILWMTEIKSCIELCCKQKTIRAQIDTYSSGESLLENNKNYDLVFLDIEMGIVDGITVAEQIRKKNTQVTIVFITAYDKYWKDAYKVHAFQYLVKPFSKEEMGEVLKDFEEKQNSSMRKIKVDVENGSVYLEEKDILYFCIEKKGKLQINTWNHCYKMYIPTWYAD